MSVFYSDQRPVYEAMLPLVVLWSPRQGVVGSLSYPMLSCMLHMTGSPSLSVTSEDSSSTSVACAVSIGGPMRVLGNHVPSSHSCLIVPTPQRRQGLAYW